MSVSSPRGLAADRRGAFVAESGMPKAVSAVLVLLFSSALAAAAPKPTPVVLATDIGDDIDDTWALALLLRSPELDLKLVLTDFGDTVYRARLAARLLEAAKRTDVPIAVGLRQAERGGPEDAWIRDYPLARYPGRVLEDGVSALVDAVMRSPEPMTLIAIGPGPTLRAALEREPRLAGRLRFAGMYGSLREGYARGSKPEPEWNVRSDVPAARAILGARWRGGRVTPLDTCARVVLDGPRYARLRASRDPLVAAVFESQALWCPNVDWCAKDPKALEAHSSTLYDTVAVYLAFASDRLRLERVGVRVADDGLTIEDPSAPGLDWAVGWKDLDGFESLLTDRLAGGNAPPSSAPNK